MRRLVHELFSLFLGAFEGILEFTYLLHSKPSLLRELSRGIRFGIDDELRVGETHVSVVEGREITFELCELVLGALRLHDKLIRDLALFRENFLGFFDRLHGVFISLRGFHSRIVLRHFEFRTFLNVVLELVLERDDVQTVDVFDLPVHVVVDPPLHLRPLHLADLRIQRDGRFDDGVLLPAPIRLDRLGLGVGLGGGFDDYDSGDWIGVVHFDGDKRPFLYMSRTLIDCMEIEKYIFITTENMNM